MPPAQILSWADPLALAAGLDEPYWVLLHTSTSPDASAHVSYLACTLAEKVEASDFTDFAERLSHDQAAHDNAWFGYLGYGLKDALEPGLPSDRQGWPELPHLIMMRFARLYRFDHRQKRVEYFSRLPAHEPAATSCAEAPGVESLSSNMSSDDYLAHVQEVLRRIARGDLYQANLTRKYRGALKKSISPLGLFARLCKHSPAPYSAMLRLGDTSVLSSSPELFLQGDATGRLRVRPIKGTAARHADPRADALARHKLEINPKDRAENLMIVDLMRNDLSRSCVPGSIRADSLFEVSSHTGVHHLSSTVAGRKHTGISTLEAVMNCFPPGSMTGAPKIAAMRLCSELERDSRGIYSGALGWFGGDGSCELSVIIRTLVLQGRRFEFQVGGAIVADSVAEQELYEILLKSRGLSLALGLSEAQMRML